MSKRKVLGVFDNGTGLVQRSQYMLQEDGTIGDAISCFQTNHAPLLWKTPSVELVGILSDKDMHLPYGQATPSLIHSSFKLQDVMESDDFLVFRKAGTDGGTTNDSNDDGEEGTNEKKPASVVVKKKKATSYKANTPKAARMMSFEARQLADYLPPPLTGKRRSTRQKQVMAITGRTGLDNSTKTPSKKRAKLKHEAKIEDDSSARRHHEPKHKQAQTEQPKKEKVLEGRNKQGELKDPTPCDGPFPHNNRPGSLIVQKTRRVYVCHDNDTPLDIETKFGVDVDRIVYDNRPLYPSLRKTSRLKPLTVIVLPLEDNTCTTTADAARAGKQCDSDSDNEWHEETISVPGKASFIIYSKKST